MIHTKASIFKGLGLVVLLAGVLSSCAVFKSDQETRFSPDVVKLGMSKDKFIREFGRPSMQNTYMDEGVVIDELVYIEAIFFRHEARKVNSTFVFKDGKLVRREQAEDLQYLQQQQFEKFLELQKKDKSETE